MDDFSVYIKKQFANLIKRTDSPHLSQTNLLLSKNSQRRSIINRYEQPQPLWKQYRREKISQTSCKLPQKNTDNTRTVNSTANKSNSLLLKQMLIQQNTTNRQIVKEDNSMKTNIRLSLNEKQSGRQSKRSRRSTVYEKVLQPLPFTRQVSGLSDNYLQAKRSFSRKQAIISVKLKLQQT